MLRACMVVSSLALLDVSLAELGPQPVAESSLVEGRRATQPQRRLGKKAKPVDRRTDLCDRAKAVQNGSVPLRDALRGLTISVVVEETWSDVWLQRNATTGAWTGFEYELVQVLAERGGFSTALYSHDWDVQAAGWDEWLFAHLPYHDFASTWSVSTLERAAAGIFSPYGFLDTSLQAVMEAHKKEVPLESRMLTWTMPFSLAAWLLLLVVTGLTGLLYSVVELGAPSQDGEDSNRIANPGRRSKWRQRFAGSMFMSFHSATGSGSFEPTTPEGNAIQLSWSFTVMILLAAYTANLARHLVIQGAQVAKYDSVDAGIVRGASFCIPMGGSAASIARQMYPRMRNVVYIDDYESVIDEMVQGRCAVAIASQYNFQLARRSNKLNPECALTTVGSYMHVSSGGFMVGTDFSDKCTTLVRSVLEVLFMDIVADRTLRNLFQRELVDKHNTRTEGCKVRDAEGDKAKNDFYFEEVVSVILPHAVVGLACLLAWTCRRPCKRRSAQVTSSEEARGAEAPRAEAGAVAKAWGEPGAPAATSSTRIVEWPTAPPPPERARATSRSTMVDGSSRSPA